MMRYYKTIIHTTFACSMLAFVSCSDGQKPDVKPDGHLISFSSDGIATKGESNPLTNYELFKDGSKIGVLAYNLPDGEFNEAVNTPNLLYNAEMTKLALSNYIYNPLVNWPNVGKVKFLAYYPHSNTMPTGVMAVSPIGTSGFPTVTIDLQNAKGKLDFSVAKLEPLSPKFGNPDPAGTPARDDYEVNFRFKRQMSELFFTAKTVNMPPLVNMYIHTVAIRGLSTQGTYKFKDDSWELVAPTATSMLTFGSVAVPIDNNKYVDIINPGNVDGKNRDESVTVFPKKYDAVKLSIIYTLEYMKPEGGCEYRLVGSKDLPISVDWKPSTTYTYEIDCGYYEAVGDQTNLTFTVAKWTESNVNTEMK